MKEESRKGRTEVKLKSMNNEALRMERRSVWRARARERARERGREVRRRIKAKGTEREWCYTLGIKVKGRGEGDNTEKQYEEI